MSFSTVGAASTDRPLHPAGAARSRRHGRGLRRLRRGARPQGRGQVPAPRGRRPQGRAPLLGEAKALARLAHPHVIHVYEVGETGERVFLAMEFVRGQTLRQMAARAAPVAADRRAVPAGRARARGGPPGGAHPLRLQAGERAGRPRRSTPGPRLRPRPPSGSVIAGRSGRVAAARRAPRATCRRSRWSSACRRPLGPVQLLRRAVRGAARAAPLRRRDGDRDDARRCSTARSAARRVRRRSRRGCAGRSARASRATPTARFPTMAALLAELSETLPRPRGAWLRIAGLSAALTSRHLGGLPAQRRSREPLAARDVAARSTRCGARAHAPPSSAPSSPPAALRGDSFAR
jgi:hypothetical protein